MLLRKKSWVAAERHPNATKPKPAVNVKRGKRLKDNIQLQLMEDFVADCMLIFCVHENGISMLTLTLP